MVSVSTALGVARHIARKTTSASRKESVQWVCLRWVAATSQVLVFLLGVEQGAGAGHHVGVLQRCSRWQGWAWCEGR